MRWVALVCLVPSVASADVVVGAAANVQASGHVSVQPAWPIHAEYGLDFGFGAAESSVPLQGYASTLAAIVNVYINDYVGVGFRGEYVHSADPAVDGPDLMGRTDDVESDGLDIGNLMLGVRLRLWDTQVLGPKPARVGWVLDGDGGLMYGKTSTPLGAVARLTLGREVLVLDERGNGINLGFGLSGETGFGDVAAYHSALATMWFHGEGGATPIDRTRGYDSDIPYTWTMDAPLFLAHNFGEQKVDLAVGLGMGFGLSLTELLEPKIKVDTTYLKHGDDDGTTMLAASAGMRFRFDPALQLFAEIRGGYERAYGTAPVPIGSGPFIDIDLAQHSTVCASEAQVIGMRLRIGVSPDNDKMATLMFISGYGHGAHPGVFGHVRWPC
jgi:hypothetical protein